SCVAVAAWARRGPLAGETSPPPAAGGVALPVSPPPPLPLPPRLVAGQEMVESLPSFQFGAASTRNWEKFLVVPEESERRAMVTGVLGSVTPGLSALIAGSFHFLILPWKRSAMTGADSFRLLTPDRLYETVIGPITTGK